MDEILKLLAEVKVESESAVEIASAWIRLEMFKSVIHHVCLVVILGTLLIFVFILIKKGIAVAKITSETERDKWKVHYAKVRKEEERTEQ